MTNKYNPAGYSKENIHSYFYPIFPKWVVGLSTFRFFLLPCSVCSLLLLLLLLLSFFLLPLFDHFLYLHLCLLFRLHPYLLFHPSSSSTLLVIVIFWYWCWDLLKLRFHEKHWQREYCIFLSSYLLGLLCNPILHSFLKVIYCFLKGLKKIFHFILKCLFIHLFLCNWKVLRWS